MTALSWNGGPKGINRSSKHGSHFLRQLWVSGLGEKRSMLPRHHLGNLRGWDCCHHEPTEALSKESFSHKPKLRAPRPTPHTGLAWSHLSAGVSRPGQTQCVFKLYSGESWSICINPISSPAGPSSLLMFQDITNPSSCPAKTLAGNSFNQNFRECVVVIHCFLKSCLWNTLLLHA